MVIVFLKPLVSWPKKRIYSASSFKSNSKMTEQTRMYLLIDVSDLVFKFWKKNTAFLILFIVRLNIDLLHFHIILNDMQGFFCKLSATSRKMAWYSNFQFKSTGRFASHYVLKVGLLFEYGVLFENFNEDSLSGIVQK